MNAVMGLVEPIESGSYYIQNLLPRDSFPWRIHSEPD
jgi:hypothetical protein